MQENLQMVCLGEGNEVNLKDGVLAFKKDIDYINDRINEMVGVKVEYSSTYDHTSGFLSACDDVLVFDLLTNHQEVTHIHTVWQQLWEFMNTHKDDLSYMKSIFAKNPFVSPSTRMELQEEILALKAEEEMGIPINRNYQLVSWAIGEEELTRSSTISKNVVLALDFINELGQNYNILSESVATKVLAFKKLAEDTGRVYKLPIMVNGTHTLLTNGELVRRYPRIEKRLLSIINTQFKSITVERVDIFNHIRYIKGYLKCKKDGYDILYIDDQVFFPVKKPIQGKYLITQEHVYFKPSFASCGKDKNVVTANLQHANIAIEGEILP